MRRDQSGVGLVETMVGILIGMVVVLVVYNTLILAEEHKRANVGVADAQITGQLTQFILGREVANGGAALMMAADSLASCSDWRLKPLPVTITAGASANVSDSIIVFYSTSPRIVHPVRFSAGVNTPDPLPVESPNGFATGDWFVATNGGNNCSMGKITGITQWPSGDPYPPAALGGRVQLAYSPASAFNFTDTANSRVINLGPTMSRVQYRVNAGKAQLESRNLNWIDPGEPTFAPFVPMAQNIVLLKAQYGLDTNNDNVVDCWTNADDNDTCLTGVNYSGPGAGPDFLNVTSAANGAGTFTASANLARLRSIKAVRIAIVVRSEDQARPDDTSAALVNQTAFLFDCAAHDSTCGRIGINNTILQNYFRYRIYETTIPLRNSLWNQT